MEWLAQEPIVSWTHTQIVCRPESLEGNLQITVGSQESNVIQNFAPKLLTLNPVVDSVTPNTGPTEGGITVVISGKRLGSSTTSFSN